MRISIFLFILLISGTKLFAQRLPLNEELRIKNGALDLYFEYSTLRTLEDFIDKDYLFNSDAQIINECIIHRDYLKPLGINEFVNAFDIQKFLNPPNHNVSFLMNSLPDLVSRPEYKIENDQEESERNIVKGSIEIAFYKIVKNRYSFYYTIGNSSEMNSIVFSGKPTNRKGGRELNELNLPELIDTVWLKMIVKFELKSNSFDNKIQFGRLRDDYRIQRIEYVKNSNGPSKVLLVDPSLQLSKELTLGYDLSKVKIVLDSNFHAYSYYPKIKNSQKYPVFYKSDIEFGNITADFNDSLIYDGGNLTMSFPHLIYYSPKEIKKWKVGIEFSSSLDDAARFTRNSFSVNYQTLGMVFKKRLSKKRFRKGGFFEYHLGLDITRQDFKLWESSNNLFSNHIDSDGDAYKRYVTFTDIQFLSNAQMLGLNSGFSYWKSLLKRETSWLLGFQFKFGYHQTFEPVEFTSTSNLLISGFYPQYFNVNFNTNGIEDFGLKKNNFDFLLKSPLYMQNSMFLLSLRKTLKSKSSFWALAFSGGLSQSFFSYSGDVPNLQIFNSSNLFPGSFKLSNKLILQGVYNISLIRVIQ